MEAISILLNHEPERPSVVAARRGGLGPKGRSSARTSWPDLDVLCSAAMHRDEARRYQTVDALIRDIDRYLADEPLSARPDAVGYRLGKFVRRNRAAVVTATVVLAAIVGLVIFYTVRLAGARNAALAEAARTQRVQRFMLNLFEGGDDVAGPSEDLRVETLVDRGVQEARGLDAEPAIQAELYGTLGGIYQKLGKLERADSLLRESLEKRLALLGPEHPDVAMSQVSLGLLRSDQADYDAAESLIRQGLEHCRRELPAGHPAIATAMAALGQVLDEHGSYAEATEVLDEAVRLQSRKDAVTPELAATLSELSNAHFYQGHWDLAESISQRVLSMSRTLYGERHPHVADDLVNLGAIQHEQGRYAEAERYYRQALDITKSWYGTDHYKTASNLTMLGRSLLFQKRYDEATALLKEAAAIQERVFGPNHPRVASAVNELGSVALQQDQYPEAEAAFRRTIAIYRTAYPEGHYLVGTATSNLASVYQAQKDYGEAERLYRDAIGIYATTLAPDHLNMGIARIKLGRTLLRQKRFAEAEKETGAGYEILVKQTDPSVSWLQSARGDLVAIYDALKQPENASKFRAEAAAVR